MIWPSVRSRDSTQGVRSGATTFLLLTLKVPGADVQKPKPMVKVLEAA